MKKILMAAVALTALTATPAMADVSTYSVSGTVAAVCSANATGSISFLALTDNTGALTATTKSASDSAAYCNGGGTTVKIEHTNLTHSSAALVASPPSGFTGVVSFTPEVDAGATTLTGDRATAVLLGAFSGLTIKAKDPSVPANTKPLAGSYNGSIIVTLTPGA